MMVSVSGGLTVGHLAGGPSTLAQPFNTAAVLAFLGWALLQGYSPLEAVAMAGATVAMLSGANAVSVMKSLWQGR